jgi:hypothetical protein
MPPPNPGNRQAMRGTTALPLQIGHLILLIDQNWASKIRKKPYQSLKLDIVVEQIKRPVAERLVCL